MPQFNATVISVAVRLSSVFAAGAVDATHSWPLFIPKKVSASRTNVRPQVQRVRQNKAGGRLLEDAAQGPRRVAAMLGVRRRGHRAGARGGRAVLRVREAQRIPVLRLQDAPLLQPRLPKAGLESRP